MTILAAGAIVAGAAQAAGHASDVADAVQNIGRKLDGQRSVVLIVDNRTDHRLELIGESHDHGGGG